ncbi:hypothetical protein GY45DRAFT_214648 [Cubamyces sp. BRFM 1775]|nr:hypothetical protein GY45DRAFT_214648 [Cubamyces sp. BRFM 1775]
MSFNVDVSARQSVSRRVPCVWANGSTWRIRRRTSCLHARTELACDFAGSARWDRCPWVRRTRARRPCYLISLVSNLLCARIERLYINLNRSCVGTGDIAS